MTDTVAFWFALVLLGAVGADVVLNGGEAILFLGRKGLGLLHYLAFWR